MSDEADGTGIEPASGNEQVPDRGTREGPRREPLHLVEPASGDAFATSATISGEPLVPFRSILFDAAESRGEREAPAYFSDLNLDQILGSITAGREEYDLEPFFYQRLESIETIHYRHEVFRDLEDKRVLDHVTSFAQKMRVMRAHRVQTAKLRYRYQQERWFLDVVGIYCDAIGCLASDLAAAEVTSRGLRHFRDYLASYVASPGFTSLVAETTKLEDDLSRVTYSLHIKGNRATVRRYESEADYSAEVQSTFEKFRQGAVKDYRVGFPSYPDMNHVEASVLDLVARLFPDVFSALDDYCERNRDYLDATIGIFDREVQLYVAYLEHIERFKPGGLDFCYPAVSRESKAVFADNTFDLALVNKLVPQGSPVVCNDFYLEGPERIFVVSGPNQGGKTTFARTFGQLHHLASIGCPVPGSQARLFLFDKLFAHFAREEDITNASGKLEDDLVRIRDILTEATASSIVVMNEIFTSTTLHDALFLGKKVLQRVIELDLLCVCVTFVDELASLGESTVSMVSTVDADSPAERTYKVVRRPADGLAYAIAIAEKYGLTYERLKGRITS